MEKLVKGILDLNRMIGKKNLWGSKSGNYSEKAIKRNLETYFKYLDSEKIPKRQRVIFGIPLVDISKNYLVGYSILNIFSNAVPSDHENQFGTKLNYVYLRDFIINPNYWEIVSPPEGNPNKEIYYSDKLIGKSLALSNKLNKEFVCDILKENEKMKNLLERNGVFETFQWKYKNNMLVRMVL